MRWKFVFILLLTFLLALVGVWGAYLTARGSSGFIGPAVLARTNSTFSYVPIHSPGWMVLNATFNGRGRVVVLDQFTNATVFNSTVSGHLNAPIVLPHAGSYALYTSDGSMTFSGHYHGVYPTLPVQRVLYGSITILALILAVWRWKA
ncbi:hypothetical protein [Thermococcus sp. Bubb.Bath]|uniref:hypothetical protein n=1 Tax=Thermococcus sp. Bubb.Bath TaxID=1638242 RepID=UPI001438EF28|nr:hypothetical protein [Thermococcus sp. Bubb.Bath]NJF25498.1 hypothetical protein [Thermococcus sp. Bubb.Bath]